MNSALMKYQVPGEAASNCLDELQRGLERFQRHGVVISSDRVRKQAAHNLPGGRRWGKHAPMSSEVKRRIGQAYMGSESMVEIAARFGCSVSTVQKVSIELELPPRAAGRHVEPNILWRKNRATRPTTGGNSHVE